MPVDYKGQKDDRDEKPIGYGIAFLLRIHVLVLSDLLLIQSVLETRV
jgi:hypothetical protein